MTRTYKTYEDINPELFRSIILGNTGQAPVQRQSGIMAPTTIPQQRPDGLGPRFVDTSGALEESLLGIVAENLGRNAIDRTRVADAVVPMASPREIDLSEWETMRPFPRPTQGDNTREALGAAPSRPVGGLDNFNERPSVDSTTGTSLDEASRRAPDPVTDEGFRPPEFYAENLNDTQKEIYENALNGAREAGLSGVELAQYMAQLGHESDNFKTAEEYASGAAYEGREDLGNTQPGDGRRYKGRGYIQLTGRANYQAAGDALGIDLVNNPELVSSDPAIASAVSIWYWQNRVQPRVEDFSDTRAVTRIINGGYNGLEDRMTKFEQFTGGGDRGFTDLAPSDSLVPRPRPNRQE